MKVRVPASTANIGPGFDCFGLALNIYDYIEIVEGEPEDNLAYRSFKKAFQYAGISAPKVMCSISGDIPSSRGLGSSAACIIGGLSLANKYMGDILSEDEILSLAYEIEGHPDNIVPALKGGFHISYLADGRIKSTTVKVPEVLNFVIFIPDFKLSTEDARRALPQYLTYNDAVYNISRAAILVKSFITSDISLMKDAFNDKLHQVYRFPLVPGSQEIINVLEDHGCIGHFLSGSGSSIIGVFDKQPVLNDLQAEICALEHNWIVKSAKLDEIGTEII
ncbi:MAG: homoserine kinase [Thermoanaerobacteraceae bacterium]|nr:homoserine kinase [Thermoanaerobacteraceae bacterium]